MVVYFMVALTVINISLWIFFAVRFRKIFSTDSIIDKTRAAINKMIMDVNRNTERDINLVNDSSRRLKSMLDSADQKMRQFGEASDRLRDMIAESDRIARRPQQPARRGRGYVQAVGNGALRESQQASLFGDEQQTGHDFQLSEAPDGAAYRKESAASGQQDVSAAVSVREPEESLPDRIRSLYEQGMGIEDIAAELSCSIVEVQLSIDIL